MLDDLCGKRDFFSRYILSEMALRFLFYMLHVKCILCYVSSQKYHVNFSYDFYQKI